MVMGVIRKTKQINFPYVLSGNENGTVAKSGGLLLSERSIVISSNRMN